MVIGSGSSQRAQARMHRPGAACDGTQGRNPGSSTKSTVDVRSIDRASHTETQP